MKITRLLEFDAAHRVYGHESKCANLHGHRYKVEIVAESDGLDSLGRVIDFSVLKTKIGGWIDNHWDHTTILFREDPGSEYAKALVVNKDLYLMTSNPTAENMAEHLLKDICPNILAGTGVKVTKVTVWETPNCKAEASYE